MSDWLDKAKGAAQKAAEGAKNLADTAKNANYGEMFDKTKDMAKHAADEAKKAAGNIMKKDTPPTAEIIPPQDNPQTTATQVPPPMPIVAPAPVPTPVNAQNAMIVAKLEQAERLLHEIKGLLK